MKINKLVIALFAVLGLAITSCIDTPVDPDGLLITTRTDCYVSNFSIYDSSQMEILLTGSTKIDTLEQVVVGFVKYGQKIDYVWPRVSLCEDAKLEPKITTWTDFTPSKLDITFIEGDWSGGAATDQLKNRIVAMKAAGELPKNALKYTVISGTRKVKKEYTFVIVERPLQ